MTFLRALFVFSFVLLLSSTANSQYYYYNDRYYDRDWIFEFGGGVGGMNSITDIGGSKGKGGMYINDLNLKYTQMASGVYFGAMYQQFAGVRAEATWGSVRGADDLLEGASNDGAKSRYNRNLSFFSTINEIAIIGEFHPLALPALSSNPPVLSPYVMLGLGWFSFNPQMNMGGRYIDLRPLRTEGQGMAEYKDREIYHLKQANVPFGIGLKYELSELFTLRAEFLHRFLFTDYLDDVSKTYIDPALFDKYLTPIQASQANSIYSRKRVTPPFAGEQRGNQLSKDAYMTVNLKVGITLGRERRR